jgi:hypothetical protein
MSSTYPRSAGGQYADKAHDPVVRVHRRPDVDPPGRREGARQTPPGTRPRQSRPVSTSGSITTPHAPHTLVGPLGSSTPSGRCRPAAPTARRVSNDRLPDPRRADRPAQVIAEDAGLTYLNSIAVARPFALRTTRRFAHAHWTITLLAAGPPDSPARFFAPPPDVPKAASGLDYPLDWWVDIAKYERRGLLRYHNALPPALTRRIVLATTRGPQTRRLEKPKCRRQRRSRHFDLAPTCLPSSNRYVLLGKLAARATYPSKGPCRLVVTSWCSRPNVCRLSGGPGCRTQRRAHRAAERRLCVAGAGAQSCAGTCSPTPATSALITPNGSSALPITAAPRRRSPTGRSPSSATTAASYRWPPSRGPCWSPAGAPTTYVR